MMQLKRIEVKNTNITFHATDAKNRAPILFVHGAGGSKETWRAQLRKFDKKIFSIALDLPAHGESGGKSCDSIDDYVKFLADFMDSLKIEKAIICGHSMGGAIAQKFALTYPERTKAIVLVATGAKLKVLPTIFELLKTDFEKYLEMFRQWAFGPNAKKRTIDNTIKLMRACPVESIINDFIACDRFNLLNEVQNIKVPTQVIGARFDNLTPVKYSEYLAQNISGARLELIEESGHMIPLEQPILLSKIVADFIDSV